MQRDRGDLIGAGGMWLGKWSIIVIAVAAAAAVLGWVIGELWVIILPVLLAIVVSTVLWPPARFLMKRGVPPALASLSTLLLALAVFGGVVASIVPAVINQVPELIDKATEGIEQLQDWVQGPPINLQQEQIENAIGNVVDWMQNQGSQIASGVYTGVSTVGSSIITLVMVVVLTFFFVKDGQRFLPWLHTISGSRAGRHVEAVSIRMWDTLGGFIRTQALVSLIDAVFIGAGLLILGVPLAPVLAIITFIGGFIPFVGAFVAGALAVLVALVANGFTTALIVLAIIIAVQQIEGNVLQPVLQSRSMNLHAVVVLLSVTAGGSLFGIIGAFLAVPTAAVAAVVLRYINEQVDVRTSDNMETPPRGEEPEPDPDPDGTIRDNDPSSSRVED
ncbi:hypothetical protein Rrhod_2564 [Rhodococcus rhodnii LMG 5362]|uniref:AI-2E family transporter n=2 Tax=Rhodococcus rhodnii TaxID=38312 RepID=R7WLM0_9NOCA|nr:hypothetical protein Rrhod_2564 [Rhodococcus rhodnii LMG 5362]